MADFLSLTRLIASGFVAGAILYAIYRGRRWRFPRLGPRRAKLIVGLGAIFLASLAFSSLRTVGVECIQHKNTVLLRGERIINFREDAAPLQRPMTAEKTARVRDSCAFIAQHCPLDPDDNTRMAAHETCLAVQTGDEPG